MNQIKLFPFEANQIQNKAEEIPYGINLTKAPEMWERGEKGQGVVVAVLDTGCQIDHPDLVGRIIGGKNFAVEDGEPKSDFSDNHHHGTHVSGIIAANINGTGVVGMAPEAKLLVLKVLSKNGIGSYDALIKAINYATLWRGQHNERVRVINMSLGGNKDDPELHKAIKLAAENEILIVCAAGNSGDGNQNTDEIMYPGYYDEVIEVGAVGLNKEIAYFTNSNKELDIFAPGVNILSTYPINLYASLSGTSMAAPHVSGAAALIIHECEKKSEIIMTRTEILDEVFNRSINNSGFRFLSL